MKIISMKSVQSYQVEQENWSQHFLSRWSKFIRQLNRKKFNGFQLVFNGLTNNERIGFRFIHSYSLKVIKRIGRKIVEEELQSYSWLIT